MDKKAIRRVVCGVLGGVLCLLSVAGFSGQTDTGILTPQTGPLPQVTTAPDELPHSGTGLSRKQTDVLMKDKYKKMRQDTAELVKLAQNLQKSVNSSSSQVLSVNVIKTSAKIEKLAKKIRENARGY